MSKELIRQVVYCTGAGEKPGISVVWRLGSTLREIPLLPPRAGVAPLGRARGAQAGPAGASLN
jgi:hypothetical protein